MKHTTSPQHPTCPMPTGSEVIGISLPNVPHAISVSLPTWEDNIGWVEGHKRVLDVMTSGYPRFFVHRQIRALAAICEQKFGQPGEKCFLFPAAYIANEFQQFMIHHSPDPASPISVRLVQYFICLEQGINRTTPVGEPNIDYLELQIALFPEDAFPLGKQFWQHTGLGISSRLASVVLDLLARNGEYATPAAPITSLLPPGSADFQNDKQSGSQIQSEQTLTSPSRCLITETVDSKYVAYFEERHVRNLLQENAASAKSILRQRIADALANDSSSALLEKTSGLDASKRGVDVTQDDVFLFPSGMAAIWTSYQLVLSTRPQHKSVCFGFPYTDTLKILQKWGPGCHFFARGQEDDINELISILQTESISVLYTEFPSNPLLRSTDLPRLRELADKHDFLIAVDETIGNFAGVQVLPYVDMIVSSLSKVFSGSANALGGSLVLNPKGKHYQALKSQLERIYKDSYWAEDAIFMERNSRDFIPRVHTMNQTAEALCDFLRGRSLSAPAPARNTVIKEVYYPKWETRANYDMCKRPSSGFGGLFSITFTTMAASCAFFDSLDCAKGPSLGTNFTLVCPYTILAHYAELDWAETYGVDTGLVRVSVGLEEREDLLSRFMLALEKAEATAHLT
ncbi:unnamed protein product [Rhizoctonia solani]|uniref:Cystathionine gamma-synthase n=1 Tax=Rhizoctonia solani TaxID=456999 RepID=A0A8H3GG10_9AGAM|nr:unnamed protein product [Rhizoctonia solani]